MHVVPAAVTRGHPRRGLEMQPGRSAENTGETGGVCELRTTAGGAALVREDHAEAREVDPEGTSGETVRVSCC